MPGIVLPASPSAVGYGEPLSTPLAFQVIEELGP